MSAIKKKMQQSHSKTNWFNGFNLTQSQSVFLKAQASAFTSGICDYGIMIALTTYAHLFYSYSIIVSGTLGAVINFSINRYWTFKKTETASVTQLQKFAVMVAISIFLKSSGTYLLTEFFKIDYRISRLCMDAMVSLGVNFTLQKYWVFKK